MAAARAVTLTVGIGPLETVSEGVLDSRNVRVSISAPEGPSAFSVWEGVRNVVMDFFPSRRAQRAGIFWGVGTTRPPDRRAQRGGEFFESEQPDRLTAALRAAAKIILGRNDPTD